MAGEIELKFSLAPRPRHVVETSQSSESRPRFLSSKAPPSLHHHHHHNPSSRWLEETIVSLRSHQSMGRLADMRFTPSDTYKADPAIERWQNMVSCVDAYSLVSSGS